MSSILVYLVACHGGPAAHFAEFATELQKQGIKVEVTATGPALAKFKELNIKAREFNPEKLDIDSPIHQETLAAQIAATCAPAEFVITDLGHPLMERVHVALPHQSSNTPHFAYYDNPEPYVPGGYSEVAAKVMAVATKVLFSNANLAQEPSFNLPQEKRVAIGYTPLQAAHTLNKKRKSLHEETRKAFLTKYQIEDKGQKILVYFGGNNTTYYDQAFPAFLKLTQEASLDPDRYVIVLHQHPGAKQENKDRIRAEGWKKEQDNGVPPLIVSEMTSDEAQILADGALYYQTSMGPQFLIAGIPCLQVAHEPYNDILVRNQLAHSVTIPEDLKAALEVLALPQINAEAFYKDLGISPTWQANLKALLK